MFPSSRRVLPSIFSYVKAVWRCKFFLWFYVSSICVSRPITVSLFIFSFTVSFVEMCILKTLLEFCTFLIFSMFHWQILKPTRCAAPNFIVGLNSFLSLKYVYVRLWMSNLNLVNIAFCFYGIEFLIPFHINNTISGTMSCLIVLVYSISSSIFFFQLIRSILP